MTPSRPNSEWNDHHLIDRQMRWHWKLNSVSALISMHQRDTIDYSNIIDYAGLSFQWQILKDIKYIFIKTLLSFYRTEPERLAVLKADNSSVNNSDNLLIIKVIFFYVKLPPKFTGYYFLHKHVMGFWLLIVKQTVF